MYEPASASTTSAAPPPIALAIHDLNARGGQDRATLELARELSLHTSVYLIAFTLDDPAPSAWGQMRFHPVRPHLSRPVLLKDPLFHLAIKRSLPKLPRGAVLCGAGACTLDAELVHVHFVHAAWQAHRPRTEPISPYRRAFERYAVAMERRLVRRPRRYVAVSRSVASDLERFLGVDPAKIDVVPHGVDVEHFRPPSPDERRAARAALGLPPAAPVLAFVSALSERKGLDTVIAAHARLLRVSPDLTLLLAGSGDRAFYEQLARTHGTHARTRFLGHARDVRPIYWAADALALPTRYEPFGMVIPEAMACGVPVAVSALAGASEQLRSGDSCVLLDDPEDADALARGIEPLLERALTVEARAVDAQRTWAHAARELLAVASRVAQER